MVSPQSNQSHWEVGIPSGRLFATHKSDLTPDKSSLNCCRVLHVSMQLLFLVELAETLNQGILSSRTFHLMTQGPPSSSSGSPLEIWSSKSLTSSWTHFGGFLTLRGASRDWEVPLVGSGCRSVLFWVCHTGVDFSKVWLESTPSFFVSNTRPFIQFFNDKRWCLIAWTSPLLEHVHCLFHLPEYSIFLFFSFGGGVIIQWIRLGALVSAGPVVWTGKRLQLDQTTTKCNQTTGCSCMLFRIKYCQRPSTTGPVAIGCSRF